MDQRLAADPERGIGSERLDEERHPEIAAGLECRPDITAEQLVQLLFLAGERVVERQLLVLGLSEPITVPYGAFIGCLRTRDFTALEPQVEENKYFCPGVGQVAAIATLGAPEHEELIAVTMP